MMLQPHQESHGEFQCIVDEDDDCRIVAIIYGTPADAALLSSAQLLLDQLQLMLKPYESFSDKDLRELVDAPAARRIGDARAAVRKAQNVLS